MIEIEKYYDSGSGDEFTITGREKEEVAVFFKDLLKKHGVHYEGELGIVVQELLDSDLAESLDLDIPVSYIEVWVHSERDSNEVDVVGLLEDLSFDMPVITRDTGEEIFEEYYKEIEEEGITYGAFERIKEIDEKNLEENTIVKFRYI